MSEQLRKLFLIVSAEALKNMKGNRGRMVTQGGHGWVHVLWDAMKRFPADVEAYQNQDSAFKITLVVENDTALRELATKYKDVCGVSLVEERGTRADGTVNEDVKGVTCLGLGPISMDAIGDDLKALKVLL